MYFLLTLVYCYSFSVSLSCRKKNNTFWHKTKNYNINIAHQIENYKSSPVIAPQSEQPFPQRALCSSEFTITSLSAVNLFVHILLSSSLPPPPPPPLYIFKMTLRCCRFFCYDCWAFQTFNIIYTVQRMLIITLNLRFAVCFSLCRSQKDFFVADLLRNLVPSPPHQE